MIEKLKTIFEAYNEFVQECIFFDDSLKEIPGFDEWAEAHHGIPRDVSNEHFHALVEA